MSNARPALSGSEQGDAPDEVDDIAGLRLGAAAMVLTQIVMVAVMTMKPVHMRDHGHGLGATGLVIAVHIALMYLPSPLTGRLADRYGSRPVLAASGICLLAAGLLAAASPKTQSRCSPSPWRCSAWAGTWACSAAPHW